MHRSRGAPARLVATAVLVACVHAAPTRGQAVAGGGDTPVQVEFRAFDGVEEVTAGVRLHVTPAGAGTDTIESEAPTLALSPGLYDVEARWKDGDGLVAIKRVERVTALHYPDDGERHLEVINFQSGFGALQLRSERDPVEAYAMTIFPSGNLTTPAGPAIDGSDYVLFVVPAGRYDVRVEHAEHDGSPDTHWLIGVEVPPGRTRLKIVDSPG